MEEVATAEEASPLKLVCSVCLQPVIEGGSDDDRFWRHDDNRTWACPVPQPRETLHLRFYDVETWFKARHSDGLLPVEVA